MIMHKTWWGEAFVNALEGFIEPGRLQRGRAYSTENRILQFDINGSVIKAILRGNINPYFGVTKEPRYNVKLEFKPITKTQWQHIIKKICENPSWLSKLMLNELPADIQDAFNGEHFLPTTYTDINVTCSCPDYENPCKHIAGVYYRIASLLDNNPMLLFPLKGLDAFELHQELRKSELGKAFSEHLSTPTDIDLELSTTLYPEINTTNDKETITLQQFWGHTEHLTAEPIGNQERENTQTTAALIKKQGDYPPFWDRHNSFIKAMEHIYRHIRLKNKAVL